MITESTPSETSISVIIPTLNESAHIAALIESLRAESPPPEIIIVDGGSYDNTADIARPLADKVVVMSPGRGGQLNAGARLAEGKFVWFLHADSQITPGSIIKIVDLFAENRELLGGAFRLKFNAPDFSLRLIAAAANLRSRLFNQPWGDQGIFVRRDSFESLGGFPDWPILEDLEFMRRLTRCGETKMLTTPIITSARRYRKLGTWRSVMLNFRILWWFRQGHSIEEISKRFRPLHEQGGGASS